MLNVPDGNATACYIRALMFGISSIWASTVLIITTEFPPHFHVESQTSRMRHCGIVISYHTIGGALECYSVVFGVN